MEVSPIGLSWKIVQPHFHSKRRMVFRQKKIVCEKKKSWESVCWLFFCFVLFFCLCVCVLFCFCTRPSSSRGDYEMGSVCVGVCVGGVWMCSVDWPRLLHTLHTHVTWLWPPFNLWPRYRGRSMQNPVAIYFTHQENLSSTCLIWCKQGMSRSHTYFWNRAQRIENNHGHRGNKVGCFVVSWFQNSQKYLRMWVYKGNKII